MRIHYSLTSPFARKVRIFAELTQEPNIQWVLTKPLESPHFREVNPLGKIPALESDSITLFDSTLICEYLDARYCARGGVSLFHRDQPGYFPIQKQHYLANGIMDAAVSAVMDARRPDATASAFWLQRWCDSIKTGISAIEVDLLGSPEQPTISGIASACALGYLNLRMPEISPVTFNPRLALWYTSLAHQNWFKTSEPKDQ